MTNTVTIQSTGQRTMRRHPPLGTSTIEVLVAFTLLTTVLALSVPLVVRHGRLLITARHYRLAFEELSNQLDRLTALPETEMQSELRRLTPSPYTAARLPGAELSGEFKPADIGGRITLRIVWDEPQRGAAPLSMAAWVVPMSERSGRPPTENEEL